MSDPMAPHWQRFALRSPTLPPSTTTNAALVGEGDFLVIDPGSPWPEPQALLQHAIQTRLDAGDRWLGVVLTHHHPDHVGGLESLAEFWPDKGCLPVMAHSLTLGELGLSTSKYALQSLEDEEVLVLGSVSLEVFYTPGHSRGHVAFLDRAQRVAYVGDMVASEGSILINPPDGEMAAYLDSLRRLQALDLQAMMPSHGVVIEEVQAHLAHYIQHRLAREAMVLEALSADLQELEALVPAAYPELEAHYYPWAARSLLAHLIKLRGDGLVEKNGSRWRRPGSGAGEKE